MNGSFRGRPESPVALVTGASGGLGQEIALELDSLGCRVAIHYNSSREQALALQSKLNNDSVVVAGDIGSHADVLGFVKEVEESLGAVNVLVNNSAIRKDSLMAMQSVSEWSSVIQTNLIGSFHTTRETIPGMLRQRWGRVVNVVSPSGIIATAGQTAYSASKAGLIGFTRTLAAECGRRGVTVNALSPGFMPTTMTKGLPEGVVEGIRKQSPIPDFVTPREVVLSMRLFLEMDHMTGQVISVDSGVSIT